MDERLGELAERKNVTFGRRKLTPRACVAEGIESRADLVAAIELGFDLVQGYLFGKPMPLKKFARSALTKTVMGQA